MSSFSPFALSAFSNYRLLLLSHFPLSEPFYFLSSTSVPTSNHPSSHFFLSPFPLLLLILSSHPCFPSPPLLSSLHLSFLLFILLRSSSLTSLIFLTFLLSLLSRFFISLFPPIPPLSLFLYLPYSLHPPPLFLVLPSLSFSLPSGFSSTTHFLPYSHCLHPILSLPVIFLSPPFLTVLSLFSLPFLSLFLSFLFYIPFFLLFYPISLILSLPSLPHLVPMSLSPVSSRSFLSYTSSSPSLLLCPFHSSSS